MLNISQLRKNYKNQALDLNELNPNPFVQFEHWFQEALNNNVLEPNAMILATASKEGRPSSRTILLKKMDEKGFVFFTNYKSRKGNELAENPFASATFFWKEVEQQITIEGNVKKISVHESHAYFANRPRGSQLGTWASQQGERITSREELEKQYALYEEKFKNKEIPCPPDWGGYQLIPQRFEFWQGRPNRLHDRFEYVLNEKWLIYRLSP